jgi:hypothetical protein
MPDREPERAEPATDQDAAPPETPLQKQVDPYRPWYRREDRLAVRLVAISLAVIAASAGLFAWRVSSWTWKLDDEPPPAATAPAVEPMAGPLDDIPPAGEITALLATDDPIGQPVDRLAPREGAPALRGVAAAADRYGVIAVWSDRVVWVSRDDGRSFHQELAAPEPLSAVAVGRDGRVYAARMGGKLGELTPDALTRWHRIGSDQILAIDAGSPWLAVLGLHADRADGLSPVLWLSDDDGRSWRRLVPPHHGDADNQIRVNPDGVIDLLTADGGVGEAGRLRHYAGHVDGRPFELRFAGDDPQPFGLGHDGRSWQLAGEGRRMRLSVAGRPAASTSGRPLAVRNWDLRVAASRERTMTVADGRLVEIGSIRPRILAENVPGAVDALAVDGLGRSVAVVGGAAVRHSTRHEWRLLFEIPHP